MKRGEKRYPKGIGMSDKRRNIDDLTKLLVIGHVSVNKWDSITRFAEEFYDWKESLLNKYCLENCVSYCCTFEKSKRTLVGLSEEELRAVFQLKPKQQLSQNSLGVPIVSASKGYLTDQPYIIMHYHRREDIAYEYRQGNGTKTFGLKNFKTCPSLKDNLCEIYYNSDRPKSCKAMPVDFSLQHGFGMYLDQTCPGTRNIKLSYLFQRCKEVGVPLITIKPVGNGKLIFQTIA